MWSAAGKLRKRLIRLAWFSLAGALASGALWLLFEGVNMSGRPLGQVLSGGVVATVLTRTAFGHDWELRLLLAGLLACCLAIWALRDGRPLGSIAQAAALLLSASDLAALAWAGHALDTEGLAGDVHLWADVAHLLAAGAWLGGLVPLALLFAHARRTADPTCAAAVCAATMRFSTIGIISVATLVLTGIANTWFLVGAIPALIGTQYGRLLLIKIGLFGVMVSIAAVNRLWLTRGLLGQPHGGDGATSIVLRAFQRNSLVEASLGLIVLMIIGALGILTPALHVQPWWPLSFRLEPALAIELPGIGGELTVVVAGGIAGFILLILAIARPPLRRLFVVTGLISLAASGWGGFRALAVAAYPTSYYRSPVSLTTVSVARGARLYAENCASCHGANGRGDGPAVRVRTVLPTDLTTAYILAQPEGDLFWWITHGRGDGAMPAFSPALEDTQEWDIINFLRAQASGVQARGIGTEVTAVPGPLAPDFPFETRSGRQETLRGQLDQDAVLLVFFSLPTSRPRLDQLSSNKDEFAGVGLRIVAAPLEASPAPEQADDFLRRVPMAISTDPNVPETYRLFERRTRTGGPPQNASHVEFLIDKAGRIRARWSPGDNPDWGIISNLYDQVRRLERLPSQAAQGGHIH